MNKYYLVDEDRYNSFLNKNNYDPEHLKVAENDLNNILNNPNLNISSKNALYNIALKSLIKKRKIVNEKPIKVEDTTKAKLEQNIKDLVKLIQNPEKDTEIETLVDKKTPKIAETSIPTQVPKLTDQSLDDSISEEEMNNQDIQSLDDTQGSSDEEEETTISSPRIWPSPERNQVFLPNLTNNRESVSTPVSKRQKTSTSQLNDQKSEALASYMLNKPEYGFTEKGELVSPKSKKIVKGSNYKAIANYHIDMPGKFTPPGYKKIQQQLNKDINVQNIKTNPRLHISTWESPII